MSERRVCLDLFCGLGGFSAAFEDAEEWDVFTVDIEERFAPDLRADVMDLRPSDLLEAIGEYDVLVVLASPPCAEFSPAQNLNGEHYPSAHAVALVYHTIGLIKSLTPVFWYLENPRGRLRPIIGPASATVTYCQYGREHMKPTDLWGDHAPMTYQRCRYGDSCHESNRDGTNNYDGGPSDKAVVPYDLSEAIREACDAALDGETYEQTSITEMV